MPFRMPFAGESDTPSPDSILSHCYGALLPMFTTEEANTLRLLCREFKETVAQFPWDDIRTFIRGSLLRWRACFPRAIGAYVVESQRYSRTDGDVIHLLQGMRRLSIERCAQLTDSAYAHFTGLHTLVMSRCGEGVTDAAFVHLKGIKILDMSGCRQFTDAAFEHLSGVQELDISWCWQNTITDAAFVHLKGIQKLNMSCCPQASISDAAFKSIAGIHTLNITDFHNLRMLHLFTLKEFIP